MEGYSDVPYTASRTSTMRSMNPSGRGQSKDLEEEAEKEDEVERENGLIREGTRTGAGKGIKAARGYRTVGQVLTYCTVQHAYSLNTEITMCIYNALLTW